MSEKDGDPAFGHGDPTHGGEPGMSLRDYFAGQALGGVMANLAQMRPDVRSDLVRFAADCYRMADAMLSERDKS